MDKNEQMADSFVFYGSIADTAEAIRKTYGIEKAWKYLYAIFDYGRFGLVPTEDDDELYATGLASVFKSIESANERYNKAIDNGKRGGRKKKDIDPQTILNMRAGGMTLKQISEELGNISISTLKRRIAEAETAQKAQNSSERF